MTDQTTLEFRYAPVRMTLWVLFFAAIVVMFGYMAFKSLAPEFYQSQTGGRYRWVTEMMDGLPIWSRVGIWALLGLICAWAGWLFLRRWLSGMAPLVASQDGLTGFTGMTALRRLTIPWSDLSEVRSAQSNLFFSGKKPERSGLRKPIAPTIAVNLSMIGVKQEALMQKLAAYRAQSGV
jgi:hypothetical protein